MKKNVFGWYGDGRNGKAVICMYSLYVIVYIRVFLKKKQ